MGGAFEAFEELHANQAHDLLLAVFDKGINRLVLAAVVGQRVVDRQGKERFLLGEGRLHQLQQIAVGFLDGVLRHLRVFARGKRCGCGTVLDLAFPHVGPAPLHDEILEQRVVTEDLFGLQQVGLGSGRPALTAPVQCLLDFFFQRAEVALERVNSQRRFEVILLAAENSSIICCKSIKRLLMGVAVSR